MGWAAAPRHSQQIHAGCTSTTELPLQQCTHSCCLANWQIGSKPTLPPTALTTSSPSSATEGRPARCGVAAAAAAFVKCDRARQLRQGASVGGTAWHSAGLAWHSTAQHGAAWHGTAQQGTAWREHAASAIAPAASASSAACCWLTASGTCGYASRLPHAFTTCVRHCHWQSWLHFSSWKQNIHAHNLHRTLR